MAGVFFAVSAFVLKALGRRPPADSIAATQSINIAAIINPVFLAVFPGTAAAGVLAIISSWR